MYMNEKYLTIKDAIKGCNYKLKDIAKVIHIDDKTLYNYLNGKSNMPFSTLVDLIHCVNIKINEHNKNDNDNLNLLTIADTLCIYDDEHKLSDIEIDNIRKQEKFLQQIQTIENKFDLTLFEATTAPEFNILRLIFNSVDLKEYVKELTKQFNILARFSSQIQNIEYYTADNCARMTETERKFYFKECKNDKDKYGKWLSNKIDKTRTNIDNINHDFFQPLLDKYVGINKKPANN